jgi:superfamily II DNA or RNA helicase
MQKYNLYNNLTNDDNKIIQNDSIKIKLKEHQKTAINAMINFENIGKVTFSRKAYIKNYNIYDGDNNYFSYLRSRYDEKRFKDIDFEIETNYGILADKVGSGKTFMIMGLISYYQTPKERDRIISSSIYSVMKYKDPLVPIKTNLIIVPHNLTTQWKHAFKYSSLRTFTVMKRAEIDHLIYDNSDNLDNLDNLDDSNFIYSYDCIIVSSTMFDLFYNRFQEIKWSRIIIDEIVSIKLPTDIEFKCNFMWFMTATPTGLRHVRRSYIRTLVSHIPDYTINNIIVKNNDDFVDTSMNLPSINQIIIKCLTPKELNIVKGYVNEDIMSMLNAGNVHEAIIKLNCNIETSDNILEVITKKIKKDIHNQNVDLEYYEKRDMDDEKREEVLKKIKAKIIVLENQCKALEERIKAFKEENCPICYDVYVSPMLITCCNNLCCLHCLTKISKCPYCRTELEINKCISINDNKQTEVKETKEVNNEPVLCSKIDNLITLIKMKPNAKFLVFSNYDVTFDNVMLKLLENDIKYGRLVGSGIVINNIIKKFENGDIKVLMLNATNYGSGLNLQMATDIIIYHELNLELETQVIGRAQRLGRTEPLNIYYLLHDNENINCKNPTLSLDIFENDTSMLEKFINDKNNDNIDILEEKDDDEEKEVVPEKTKSKGKKIKATKKIIK